MEYFKHFQDFEYSNVNAINILARSKIKDYLKKNMCIYDDYYVKDHDRIDILADNYYGNSKYTWLIMYANDIYDPINDWVMNDRDFNKFLNTKYRETLYKPYLKYGAGTKVQFNGVLYNCTTTHQSENFVSGFKIGDNKFKRLKGNWGYSYTQDIPITVFNQTFGYFFNKLNPEDGRYLLISSSNGTELNNLLNIGSGTLTAQPGSFDMNIVDGFFTSDMVGKTITNLDTNESVVIDEYINSSQVRLKEEPNSSWINSPPWAWTPENGELPVDTDAVVIMDKRYWERNDIYGALRPGYKVAAQTIHEYQNGSGLVVDFETWNYGIVSDVNKTAESVGHTFSSVDSNKYIKISTNSGTEFYVLPTFDSEYNIISVNKIDILPVGAILNSYISSVRTNKKVVTNYDYELDQNDKRRLIKLLDAKFAIQITQEFKKLMA